MSNKQVQGRETGRLQNEIKVTLNKYRLDITVSEDALKYNEIKRTCLDQGQKLFSVLGDPRKIEALPERQTIDTSTLFNNQYNTKEGFRIFDWYEAIVSNSNFKIGYYLSGDIERLQKIKNETLVCNYCGKQYDSNETKQIFCNSCLGSPHLKKSDLILLTLTPVVYDHKERYMAVKDLDLHGDNQALWDQHIEIYEENQKKRLKKKAINVHEKMLNDVFFAQYESSVKVALLNNGIDIENLIFHPHKGAWVYGWREQVNDDEFNAFRDRCEGLNVPVYKDGIEFLNILHKNKC